MLPGYTMKYFDISAGRKIFGSQFWLVRTNSSVGRITDIKFNHAKTCNLAIFVYFSILRTILRKTSSYYSVLQTYYLYNSMIATKRSSKLLMAATVLVPDVGPSGGRVKSGGCVGISCGRSPTSSRPCAVCLRVPLVKLYAASTVDWYAHTKYRIPGCQRRR